MAKRFSPEELAAILELQDLSGFTEFLIGPKRRYVVACTHNVVWSHALLSEQIWLYAQVYETITIWWRTDKDENVIVDIGTATDDLHEAIRLRDKYNQKAIYDYQLGEELP